MIQPVFQNVSLKYRAGSLTIKSLVQPTFLPIEIKLNQSVRAPIQFYSAPPGIETLSSFYVLFEVV